MTSSPIAALATTVELVLPAHVEHLREVDDCCEQLTFRHGFETTLSANVYSRLFSE